jgi:hypothetical protein
MSDHQLTLGSFDFIRGEGASWWVETIAEGMSFGGANPVDVVTQTLLQDGAVVTTERWENRELTFGVLIKGADLIAVSEGEALLYAELARRNVLTWTPPDGWGPPSVFDVLTSWAEFDFDDWGEMEPGTIGRRFVIRLTCAPFARSTDEVVVEAVVSGDTPEPITETIDDCTSVTGWTASRTTGSGPSYDNFGPFAQFGMVTTGTNWTPPNSVLRYPTLDGHLRLIRSGLSAPMTDTRFLVIDAQANIYGVGSTIQIQTFWINGVATMPTAQLGAKYYFDCLSIASIETVEVEAYVLWSTQSGGVNWSLAVHDISRTSQPPFIGTGRQQFRSISVQGSARTQGSIQLAHETTSLGEVVAYTNAARLASGYQPACRGAGYRTAGGTVTPDANTASGGYAPLNSGTPETFDIPAAALPTGSYSIMARIRGDSTAITGVSWAASTLVGSTSYATQSGSTILRGGTTTTWLLYEIARVVLPPDDLPPGSAQKVRVTLSSSALIYLDELYLFNTDIGHLTWVSCGTGAPATGGSSNRLWIDTATLDRPREAIWLGTAADGSDRRHALGSEVRSLGTHVIEPGDLNLFTLTSNAENAAASARYYPRWANNAGQIAA